MSGYKSLKNYRNFALRIWLSITFFSSPHTTYFIMHSSFYASRHKLPFLIQWQWLIEQYRFFSLNHTHTTNSKELWIFKLNHCCFSPLCSLWRIIFYWHFTLLSLIISIGLIFFTTFFLFKLFSALIPLFMVRARSCLDLYFYL